MDGWGYFRLGVDHILSGVDYLLLVFGVLWIVAGFRRLLQAITAFTAAHSITLGLATLGVVRVPDGPVEALIALSIVRVRPRPWMRAVPACTIGSFASFWLLQRCAALFGGTP